MSNALRVQHQKILQRFYSKTHHVTAQIRYSSAVSENFCSKAISFALKDLAPRATGRDSTGICPTLSIGLSFLGVGTTLTTMLQEIQGLMNLSSDEIVCRLCAYDGNDSTHVRYTPGKGQLSLSRVLHSVEAVQGLSNGIFRDSFQLDWYVQVDQRSC